MQQSIEQVIEEKFRNRFVFNKTELVPVLQSYYADYNNPNTLNWRIHDLEVRKIIHKVGRGIYSLGITNPFRPEISRELTEIFKVVKQKLPFSNTCISDTKWYNEFMRHQVFRSFPVFEIGRESIESAFNILKDFRDIVYFNPSDEIIEHYLPSAKEPIIVMPMISESPTEKVNDIPIPTLEKLLVDCLADQKLYGAQYSEINHIFREAFNKYTVNISTLRRYARRRNRLSKAETLIKNAIA